MIDGEYLAELAEINGKSSTCPFYSKFWRETPKAGTKLPRGRSLALWKGRGRLARRGESSFYLASIIREELKNQIPTKSFLAIRDAQA